MKKPGYSVFVHAEGSDENDGKSLKTAVLTMARAKEIISEIVRQRKIRRRES